MSFLGTLRQSTAVNVIIGPFVDSTNGDDEETGLTIAQADVRLSKNAGADAQKNDATTCAHEGDGFYMCELDATDTNTVGSLTLWVHVAGALAVRHDFQVIEEAIYDALFAASANAWSGAAGSTTLTALASGSITAAVIATGAIDADAIAADAITAAKIATGAIDADAIAADAITAAKLAADVTTEIQSGLATAAALTSVGNDVTSVLADTNELQTDWADGGRLDLLLDSVISKIDTVDDFLDTEIAAILEDTGTTLDDFIDTEIAAIKAKTDSLTFTVANRVDANTRSVNDVALTGDGTSGTPWGPA